VAEIRRYRLMPAFFDASHHALIEAGDDWPDAVKDQHNENRATAIDRLRHAHGEDRLEQVVQNAMDLGSDPWSVLAWHNQLWLDVKHTFLTCCYYSAAVAAGALGERVVNHLLIDLADDYATAADRSVIFAKQSPTFGRALTVLRRWAVLEPAAQRHFERLRDLRNGLVHFDAALYSDLRSRSLEAVSSLRDALDAQFGVFVERRLIPNTPGELYLKRAVEDEPFVRHYVLPLALHVGPRHTIEPHAESGYWVVDIDLPVDTVEDSDEQFVALHQSWQTDRQHPDAGLTA
jgi:hypothetical protein